jgi:methionyl aminopeptidase
MIRLKSADEIETLARGGAVLGTILDTLAKKVAPGVTSQELDELARELIERHGGRPSFLGYAPSGHDEFPAALCVSVNNAVVHGLPNDTTLSDGQIVGLDLGMVYEGMYLDSARTVGVGKISEEAERLLMVTRRCLARGIQAAVVGNTTGDIGSTIQQCAEDAGFSVVRQLVGHGVGYAVHEEPKVPNYGSRGRGLKLKAGLVIAIEPMVVIGDAAVRTAADGWTVETVSGNLAAHEEHTVAVTLEGPRVLTLGTS